MSRCKLRIHLWCWNIRDSDVYLELLGRFKISSPFVITLLSYVGQWIQHVICTCISIRSYCTIRLSTHHSKYCTCGRNRPAKYRTCGRNRPAKYRTCGRNRPAKYCTCDRNRPAKYCTCSRNRPAKHQACIKVIKTVSYLQTERRYSSLTVNTAIQITHHATEHQYVQHTCIKNNSLPFHYSYYLLLTFWSFNWHIFENRTNVYTSVNNYIPVDIQHKDDHNL